MVHGQQVCCKPTEGSAAVPRGHGEQISCWGSAGKERGSDAQSVTLSQYLWHQPTPYSDYTYFIPRFNCVIRIYLLGGCLVCEGGATEHSARPEPLWLSVICKARLPSANFGRVREDCQQTVSLLSEEHRQREGVCGECAGGGSKERNKGRQKCTSSSEGAGETARLPVCGARWRQEQKEPTFNPARLPPPRAGDRLPWISADGRVPAATGPQPGRLSGVKDEVEDACGWGGQQRGRFLQRRSRRGFGAG